jgi:hypothetical protein
MEYVKFTVLELQGTITASSTGRQLGEGSINRNTMVLSLAKHSLIGEKRCLKKFLVLKGNRSNGQRNFRLNGLITTHYCFTSRPKVALTDKSKV